MTQLQLENCYLVHFEGAFMFDIHFSPLGTLIATFRGRILHPEIR